jgi:hypothetical protein
MWPLVPLLSSLVMAPIFIFSLVGFCSAGRYALPRMDIFRSVGFYDARLLDDHR